MGILGRGMRRQLVRRKQQLGALALAQKHQRQELAAARSRADTLVERACFQHHAHACQLASMAARRRWHKAATSVLTATVTR